MATINECVDRFHCPICYDILIDAIYLDVCGHNFCHSCILRWLSQNQSCPVCRRNSSVQHISPCRVVRFVIGTAQRRHEKSDRITASELEETVRFLCNRVESSGNRSGRNRI